MEADSAAGTVQLGYASPDGEEGYPGAVDFRVTLPARRPAADLRDARACRTGRRRSTSPTTAITISAAAGTVQDHLLWVDAPRYTPIDAELIPTGEIRPWRGRRSTSREPREIGDTRLDHNLVLRRGRDQSGRRRGCAARGPACGSSSGPTSPGMQFFDASAMTIGAPGLDGQRYGPYAGLCLEAQHFPDSMQPSGLAEHRRTPEEPYFQRLEVEIARATVSCAPPGRRLRAGAIGNENRSLTAPSGKIAVKHKIYGLLQINRLTGGLHGRSLGASAVKGHNIWYATLGGRGSQTGQGPGIEER